QRFTCNASALSATEPSQARGRRGVGMQNGTQHGAVYLQTNDAGKNEIVAYDRAPDGSLTYVGAYETGGRGTGEPHLPSQGSVVLSAEGRWLLAGDAGRGEVSRFVVEER